MPQGTTEMATPAEDLIRRHRYTVEEYLRMGEAGILRADERVELIEGEIAEMAPIGSRHAGTVKQLGALVMKASAGHAIVSVQDPIVLGPRSAPQPDLALLRARDDFYKASHPQAQDVLLVIEVADTTQRYDRQVKVPLYARHGIPEVWIVDLESNALHVFRDPSADGYRSEARVADLGAVPVKGIPGITVDLRALFG
jgi:Uma2 family endonuclease